ncbi:MAG: cysteine dioxygenase family protein [Candidatus Thalassarchaeaceae archaeon]|jgi:cysteine dioxygenase|nr:cysteine dioxygenase family protein [Candidatus Thalassarchaeaceae archaeon]MDP7004237.1 cysteine dioxygenase family protein [Candidatus Thalassarchaeaceae archaeon]
MVAVVTMSDEDRDDLIACCKGLADTIEWLDSLNARPGLAELGARLDSLPLNLEALKQHIVYTEDNGYQRNIIKKTEHYEVVAITWRAGQDTPIHDHVGSDCAFLIVEGTSTETIYELGDDHLAVATDVRHYSPGDVCAAEEPDVHRISNDTDGDLINLHVYTPPLSGFGIYEAA